MSLIRRISRPLLGAGFIAHGVDRLRHSDEAASTLEPTLEEISALVPQAEPFVSDSKRVTQVLGGVEVVAGLALAIGRCPRVAALTLAGVHQFNSYVEYRTATLDEVDDLSAQRTTALKNLGILGGLGLATVDLDGKPSLAWRAEHISKQAKKKGTKFGEKTLERAETLGEDALKVAKSLEKDARKSFQKAEKEAKKAVSQAAKEAKKTADLR